MSVAQRLRLLGVASLVGVLVTASVLVISKRAQMLDDRRQATKHVVEVAAGIVESFAEAERQGVVSRDEAQHRAKALLSRIRYEGKDYVWVHSLDDQMVMHPMKPELDGTSVASLKDPEGVPLFVVMNALVRSQGKGFVEYQWPKPGATRPVSKVSFVQGVAWGWVVGSGIYVDDVNDAFVHDVIRVLVVLALLGLVLMASYWWVSKSIVEPLHEAMVVARRTASGDLSQPISVEGERDELSALLASLGSMQRQLQTTVAGIRRISDVIHSTMQRLLGGNEEVERRTMAQVAKLSETAATIEELSTTVRNNVETARQADEQARVAADVAQAGGEAVNRVVTLMAGITASAQRIGDISTVIDDMAFQTNLLALNANVEAARAGAEGRGFAVVAGEVRELALRSASSAREIKTLVDRAMREIEGGAQAAREAGVVVRDVVVAARGVASLVAEITRASEQQSQAIEQASSAVTDIDRSTQQNATVVGTTAVSAREVTTEAQALALAVSRFRLAGRG